MDVIEIARTVFRRWYVIVPVLAVTAVLAFVVASGAEAEYETSGSFLLTDASLVGGSQSAAGGGGVTPQLISEVVQGDPVRTQIREGGGTAEYEIAADSGEGLLRITANGDSEQAAVATVSLVAEAIERELTGRQDAADVPEQRRAAVEVLTLPSTARQELVETVDDTSVRFVASGSLRFIGPTDQGGNPYAASLSGTMRVLEEVLISPQVRQEVMSAGGRGVYELGTNPRDSAPIMNIVARAPSPQGAMDTFGAVAERMRAELQERQEIAGAPASSMLTLEPLSVPVGVSLIGGELRRPLMVIVGLGVVAAVSLAVLVESLAGRARRGRRERGYLEPSGAALTPDGEGRDPRFSEPVRGA